MSTSYDEAAFQQDLAAVLDQLQEVLVEKNRSYGNSVLDPVRIFSRAQADEQLKVRIDDKLSRIVRGHEVIGDDTIQDLAGYLIIFMVMQYRKHKDTWNPAG